MPQVVVRQRVTIVYLKLHKKLKWLSDWEGMMEYDLKPHLLTMYKYTKYNRSDWSMNSVNKSRQKKWPNGHSSLLSFICHGVIEPHHTRHVSHT